MNTTITTTLGVMLILAAMFGGLFYFWPSFDRGPKPPGFITKLIAKQRSKATKRTRNLFLVGLAVGIVLWLFSGIFALALIVPFAFVWAPNVFSNSEEKRNTEKLAALQKWTSGLAGLLTTGSPLETALVASLGNAPPPIRNEVSQLIARLEARWSTLDALDAFGNSLASQEADRVILSLKLAAKQRGAGLVQSLNDLADDVVEIVEINHETTASRTGPRGEAKTVTFAAAAAIIFIPLLPMFSAGYRTALGQILYIVMAVGVALTVRAMQNAVKPPKASRLLVDDRGVVK